jgi:hypothetical protein
MLLELNCISVISTFLTLILAFGSLDFRNWYLNPLDIFIIEYTFLEN